MNMVIILDARNKIVRRIAPNGYVYEIHRILLFDLAVEENICNVLTRYVEEEHANADQVYQKDNNCIAILYTESLFTNHMTFDFPIPERTKALSCCMMTDLESPSIVKIFINFDLKKWTEEEALFEHIGKNR